MDARALTSKAETAFQTGNVGNGLVLGDRSEPMSALGQKQTSASVAICEPDGRKRALARGVRFGRKPKLTVHQQKEALARRAAGKALVDIARSYAVSHSTI